MRPQKTTQARSHFEPGRLFPRVEINRPSGISIIIAYALWLTLFVPEISIGREISSKSAQSVLVGYHHEGRYALGDCAERLWEADTRFSSATSDRSSSLDRWHEKHRAKRVRALFRRPDGTSLESQSKRLKKRIGATPGSTLDLAHVYRIDLASGHSIDAAVAELRRDPHVVFAQADHEYELDFDPDDPFLSSAGSWGQPYADMWALDRIRAREAWPSTRGHGQIVAVVDTGVDYRHPDIADNIWVNPGEDLNGNGVVDAADENGRDDDGNGFVDDLRGFDFAGFGQEREDGSVHFGDPDPIDEVGHGTHVAGTIAAVANNGIGIAGVAPEARVMIVKGFADTGVGRASDLWRAVLYAVENGASVINASWSCSPPCPDNPLADVVLAQVEAAGTVFVTSAGNAAFDVVRNAPERTTAAITVGAVGFDDALSSFSNRGWLLDLLAPGGGPATPRTTFVARRNILSLAASALAEIEFAFLVGDDYFRLAGTSMAAPHVSAAAALLRAQRPELSPSDVRRLLRISARDIGDPGHDPRNGAGVLDLARLLDTPVPNLDLEIMDPSPGAVLNPSAGSLAIRVSATGLDLASASLSYSRGLETNDFVEFARSARFDVDQPVDWGVEDREDGPYVLRLRADLNDGRHVDEFSIVSLEATDPIRLSPGDFDQQSPSISGNRVVWQAFPNNRVDSAEIRSGGFTRKHGAKTPFVLSPTDRRQSNPLISGSRIIWLEDDAETAGEEIRGCILQSGRTKRCNEHRLVPVDSVLRPLRMALGRLLWSPRAGNDFQIAGCRWFPHARNTAPCTPSEIESEPGSSGRRLLDFDGRTALFFRNTGSRALEFCSPVLDPMTCVSRPVRVAGDPIVADAGAIDGSLLVFELGRVNGSVLGHCELDTETGDCVEPRIIDGIVEGREADVSGRRIVWTEFREGERSAIFFCEVEDVSGRCERRRLAGTYAPASAPKIDAHRIVWQDRRSGPIQIFGLELPSP